MNKIKTKSEQNPAPAPVPIYSDIRFPKIYKLLYKIGLVLKRIKFCTYTETQARDSEKVHKKVQKRKNRRKGVFWGVNFQKVKSIGGSPRVGYRHTLGSLLEKFFSEKNTP